MEKDILSRMGFMTQMDKIDFEKRFEILVNKIEKLEQDVSILNSGIARLEKKLDDLLSGVVDSRTVMNDVSAIVLETKNNLRIYNQSERQLLNDIQAKVFQQLKSQFDEIHYLQYNLQKTQQSADSADKNCLDIKNIFGKNLLTKDDLHVIESFLRLIAANQMIQETYFES